MDFLNINEATLFPEFEHQLVYLQNKKHPDPGQVEDYEVFTSNAQPADAQVVEVPPALDLAPQPNIQRIVDEYFSSVPELAERISRALEEDTSVIDWWKKDSMVSRINRDITRILQTQMSMQESKTLANKIVKEILTHQNVL